ncbi:MlaD family protein [Mesonia aestuariivivens]|uniref:MCE family protein n=1 Tax=Mesonia aestuariivivens TaxID=2796128 RepID=A0ABS6VYX6_9FLAO|nr:MlaD family protein [Mesonia aestuariivivens]MBW2960798.1 MCE family protein [Mesonia aestuariivivens]
MKLTNEVKTALLAIVAIILLVFGYSFLKGNNLLDNNRNFYAVYNDVEGLAVSSPVTINGLQVGSVTDIDFLDGKGRILVTMMVQNDFKFSKSSTARIYGGDLIGGKSMSIIPEYNGQKAESGDTLKGDIDEGLLELVNDRLKPLQEKIENTVVSADSLLNGINGILNQETRDNLKATIAKLNETMGSFKNAANNLDGLLARNSGKLDKTFTNLDELSTNLNSFSDTLSKIEVNRLVGEFEGVIKDFKGIADGLNDGEGTAGKLLKDDKVYNNLDRATKQLEQLLQDVKLNPKRYVHFSVFGKNPGEYKEPKDSLK